VDKNAFPKPLKQMHQQAKRVSLLINAIALKQLVEGDKSAIYLGEYGGVAMITRGPILSLTQCQW
jgi:hypothetical protein